MPKFKALLTWDDVQAINRLCTASLENGGRRPRSFEHTRQHLVTAFVAYIQDWQPGKLVDDLARESLTLALSDYAEACHALDEEMASFFAGYYTRDEAIAECLRLVEHLLIAVRGLETLEGE